MSGVRVINSLGDFLKEEVIEVGGFKSEKNLLGMLKEYNRAISINSRPVYGINKEARRWSEESMGNGQGRSRVPRNRTIGRAVFAPGTKGGRRVRAPLAVKRKLKINRQFFRVLFSSLLAKVFKNSTNYRVETSDQFIKTKHCISFLEKVNLKGKGGFIILTCPSERANFLGFRALQIPIRDFNTLSPQDLAQNSAGFFPSLMYTHLGLEGLIEARNLD